MRIIGSPSSCALLAGGLVVLLVAEARAAGPEPKHAFPLGVQRGATVEVAVDGNFPKWPLGVWIDRPGLSITAGEKGKLSVAAAADASPGVYWLRMYDDAPAAAPQPFVVGTLTQINEAEPNNGPEQAQAVDASTVVNGRLSPGGDVDHVAVNLSQGQTLVASLAAHETLGSQFDGVMQIVGPAGSVVAYNHDHGGLDPQIAFVAPADGKYLVRVFGFPSAPNSTIGFAGSDAYIYRLTLATGGFVDYPWPLAVTRGSDAQVELFGWNLPQSVKLLAVRGDGETATLSDPQLANTVSVAVEPHATAVVSEPNELAAPEKIELPLTVSGRLESPGDVDAFAFAGTKGQVVAFELSGRSLGYPIDGVLEVFDEAGTSLARADDVGEARDPVLAFSPPADGMFRIVVSDLNGQGSGRHVYRLRAALQQPEFALSTDAHAVELVAGMPTEISVAVERRHGFAEEIALSVTGLPEFVTVAPATSAAAGDSAKTVKLVLTTDQGPFSGPIRVVGTATGASQLVRTSTAAIPNHESRTSDVWLTVIGEPKK
ncbi:MAG: PPC domain-containing protein [Pirellulales bacterium]